MILLAINDAFNTRYIWVNNIPPGTVRRQLEDLFEKYATVAAIKIIRGTGDTLLGFVKLEDAKHTRKCYEKLNKFEFRGFKLELSKVSLYYCIFDYEPSFIIQFRIAQMYHVIK